MLVAFVSLWAFPLAAWFWSQHVAPDAPLAWAFLPPRPEPLPPSPRRLPPPSPLLALEAGLWGGLVAWVLLLVLRLVLRSAIPELETFRLRLFTSSILVSALVQAATALWVAWRVERLPTLHGLCAAFVAGCVSASGLVVLSVIFGGKATAGFAWAVLGNMLNWGALVALPMAAAAAVRWRPPRRELGRPHEAVPQ
jgi:hypothetical protein